jgi:hypothetical protein
VLPDDYKEDDPFPAPEKGDRYFYDEKEALALPFLRLVPRRGVF